MNAPSPMADSIPALACDDPSLTRDLELQDVSPAEQVAEFLSIISDDTDIVEIRTKGAMAGGVQQKWHYARDVVSEVPRLERLNRDRHIYIGANPRREFGLSGDVNVPLARCLFVDCDQSNGFRNVPAFMERIETARLPEPTMIVSSGHGAWSYWKLMEPVRDLALWQQLQLRLITLLGTDASGKNPERLTRLPGFTNHKPPAAMAWIYAVDPGRRYSLESIATILPPLPELPPETTPPRRLPAPTGTAHDELLKRARLYVAVPKGVGEGSRDTEVFRLAGHVASFVDEHGQCLSEDEIVVTMRAFNDRCTPPLPVKEFEAAVRSALKHGKPRDPKPPRPLNHRQIALRGREVCRG